MSKNKVSDKFWKDFKDIENYGEVELDKIDVKKISCFSEYRVGECALLGFCLGKGVLHGKIWDFEEVCKKFVIRELCGKTSIGLIICEGVWDGEFFYVYDFLSLNGKNLVISKPDCLERLGMLVSVFSQIKIDVDECFIKIMRYSRSLNNIKSDILMVIDDLKYYCLMKDKKKEKGKEKRKEKDSSDEDSDKKMVSNIKPSICAIHKKVTKMNFGIDIVKFGFKRDYILSFIVKYVPSHLYILVTSDGKVIDYLDVCYMEHELRLFKKLSGKGNCKCLCQYVKDLDRWQFLDILNDDIWTVSSVFLLSLK